MEYECHNLSLNYNRSLHNGRACLWDTLAICNDIDLYSVYHCEVYETRNGNGLNIEIRSLKETDFQDW